MATRVVSASGGNWNATATWVGGVIPTTTDDIQLASTSGPLTVNVSASILGIDITFAYANTLTINSSITLTLTSSTFTNNFGGAVFAPTYNFLGTGASQGRISKNTGSSNFLLSFSGTEPIPCFQNSSSGRINPGTGGTFYFTNLISTSQLQFDADDIYIDGNFDAGFSAVGGNARYRMVGTGTLTVYQFGIGGTNTQMRIDTAGTITVAAGGFGFGTANGTAGTIIELRHVAGTIVNPTIRANLNGINSTNTQILNLIAGTTWDFYGIANSTAFITFAGSPQFDKFMLNITGGSSVANITLDGTNITVNEFNVFTNLVNLTGTYYRSSVDIVFGSSWSMTVNSAIDLNGGSNEPNAAQTPPVEIRAASGATPNLIVNTFNQYVSRTRFTNINCSGGNTLYGQSLTLSGTTNITQYTLPPTGGGGSFTYFT